MFTGTLTFSSPTAIAPVTIPVTLTVSGPPQLSADRAQLTFQTNRLLSPSASARVSNAPFSSVSAWTASGPSWLSVAPGSGTLAAGQGTDVTVTVNPAGLPLNAPQTADVTFFDTANPAAVTARVAVPVTVTVTAPEIVLSQASMTFSSVAEGATETRAVTLTNAGTGPLYPVIAVTAGATWLGASLTGSTPLPAGGSRTLTIAVDTFALAAGTIHTATVTVSDPVAADLPLHLFQPPQQITVTVEMTPAGAPRIAASGLPLQPFEWVPSTGAPQQTIQVANTGDATLNARATASVPWLRFSWPGDARTIAAGSSTPLAISIDSQLVLAPARTPARSRSAMPRRRASRRRSP